MGRAQRLRKVRQQLIEGPAGRVAPRDQYIVGACKTAKGKHRRGGRPKPALGAVAHYRSADLLAGRETDPNRAVLNVCRRRRTDFQGDAGGCPSNAARGAQEIGANPQVLQAKTFFGTNAAQAESFLRPCARRRARTLRPPLVAMRERKPWRRLRTILLG
jgi:hypothetical protein